MQVVPGFATTISSSSISTLISKTSMGNQNEKAPWGVDGASSVPAWELVMGKINRHARCLALEVFRTPPPDIAIFSQIGIALCARSLTPPSERRDTDRNSKNHRSGARLISLLSTELLPVQCRMARAALGLGVRKLAAAAKVSPDTVVRFEREEKLRERTVASLRQVLEAAGIEFTDGNRPGVRVRKR